MEWKLLRFHVLNPKPPALTHQSNPMDDDDNELIKEMNIMIQIFIFLQYYSSDDHEL